MTIICPLHHWPTAALIRARIPGPLVHGLLQSTLQPLRIRFLKAFPYPYGLTVKRRTHCWQTASKRGARSFWTTCFVTSCQKTEASLLYRDVSPYPYGLTIKRQVHSWLPPSKRGRDSRGGCGQSFQKLHDVCSLPIAKKSKQGVQKLRALVSLVYCKPCTGRFMVNP